MLLGQHPGCDMFMLHATMVYAMVSAMNGNW